LEDCIINAREVARSRGLVLLRSQGKGIDIDTSVGGTGVVLEGLDNVKVRTLALREAVLAVELELSSDNGVLAPTVHVQSGLGENKCSGIRDKGTLTTSSSERNIRPLVLGSSSGSLKSTGHLEESRSVDEGILIGGNREGSSESMDSVGEGINGVSVVEGLSTESAVKKTSSI